LTPEWKKVRKVINPDTLEYEDWQKVDFPCLAEAKKAKTLAEKSGPSFTAMTRGRVLPGKCRGQQ
jgi:hypothetical protein